MKLTDLNWIAPLVVILVFLFIFRKDIEKILSSFFKENSKEPEPYENPEEKLRVGKVLASELIRFIPIFIVIVLFCSFLFIFLKPVWVGIIFILLIWDSWTNIDETQIGLRIVLWIRLEKGLREGLRCKWPIIERVRQFSLKKVPYSFTGDNEIIVTCGDGLNVKIEGNALNRNEFRLIKQLDALSPKAIEDGMRDKIQQELGIIAGHYKGSDFYLRKELMVIIINCYLRLPRRPDYHIPKIEQGKKPRSFKENGSPSWTKYLEDLDKAYADDPELLETIKGKLHHRKWEIPVWRKNTKDPSGEIDLDGKLNVLDFYAKNITRIVLMLNLENRMPGYSPVEELYAQDVLDFNVTNTDFTKEVKKALEKTKIAESELQAADKLQAKKMGYMQELIGAGVDANQASNDADVMIGKAEKQVITGGVPIVNIPNKKTP